MSHDAVRAFYKKLSESTVIAASYKKLASGLFGYSAAKIVAFASSHGCDFTESELAFIRLTNVLESGGSMPFARGSNGSVEDFIDYEPTLYPQKPFSIPAFYEEHNRHVEGMPKEMAIPAPSGSFIEHQMKGDTCKICGCSETYIKTQHPSCRKIVPI